MHTSSILPFVALTTVSLAAQPPASGAGGHVDYLSTFDDLEALPLVSAAQLPRGTVGPYNGLDMQLVLYQLGVNGAVTLGVVPSSKPNGAGYSALSGLQPSITTQYPGSVTDTFDFHSFYAGCVAKTQETAASVVTRCSILVQGYRATRLIAKQKVSYDFGVVGLRAPMKKFSLDNFTNVDTVTFMSEFAVGDLLGATILDDLDYTVYYPAPESRKVNGTGNL